MSKLLRMLDPFDEIKRLYFETTKDTIDRDLDRALELLRHMPTEEARERAAGYMHGLSDLQREWKPARQKGAKKKPKRKTAPPQPKRGEPPARKRRPRS